MARTFNRTSGIESRQYGLKTEKREDNCLNAPACHAIYHNLTRILYDLKILIIQICVKR